MSIFYKRTDDISEADLEALVSEQVPEDSRIDYKRAMPDLSEERQKTELMCDLTSFANSRGGWLLVGVAEENGIPIELVGLESNKLDADILRIENILESRVLPRLKPQIKRVKLSSGREVLVFRVKESYFRPHGVVVKDHYRFYLRGNAGKMPSDIFQLREMFVGSGDVFGKMEEWRKKRVDCIKGGRLGFELESKTVVVLHVIPYESMYSDSVVSIMPEGFENISPIEAFGLDREINFNGTLMVSHRPDRSVYSYVQIFSSGALEYVFCPNASDGLLSVGWMEHRLVRAITSSFSFLSRHVDPPVSVDVSYVGVGGMRIAEKSGSCPPAKAIHESELMPSGRVFERFDANIESVMCPTFNKIWNAFGYYRSDNYDNNGVWVGRE